jgi:hypothetical protein
VEFERAYPLAMTQEVSTNPVALVWANDGIQTRELEYHGGQLTASTPEAAAVDFGLPAGEWQIVAYGFFQPRNPIQGSGPTRLEQDPGFSWGQ